MIIEDKYYEYALNSIYRARKEKRKYNGWKDKANRTCFYTGSSYAERHEVFEGNPDRQICIRLGLQVDLSSEKHLEIQNGTTKWGEEEKEKWQQVYQRTYMDCLEAEGMTPKETLREWMNIFGRNYLEECDPE